MKPLIKFKTTTLLLMPLVLACFALLPGAQAGDAPTPQLALPGFNTADGFQALDSLTTGVFNSAFGAKALTADTSGSHNTAVGGQALLHNNGDYNTAVGENALVFNTTGSQNMALGQGALANNLTGSFNTAMGFQALNHEAASNQVGIGYQAMLANTTGPENVAVGFQALSSNTVSGFSVAVGFKALGAATGGQNTAVGDNALNSITTGFGNTALGDLAGDNHTGNDHYNIDIGFFAEGVPGENGTIRIGNPSFTTGFCYIAGIRNHAQLANNANIRPVTIDRNTGLLGYGGTNPVDLGFESSQRFKDEIKPLDKASEVIYALKPVTFRYKADHDPARTLRSGLIAEEVEKVNADLVMHDEEGKPAGVFYNSINVMLLNEFLKEHRKVQEQDASIADLKSTVAKQEAIIAVQQKGMEALVAEVKEQAAQIRKVSAQVEMSKPAPKVVANQ
jgi:uncharacterized coiled-coil protein SlyX